MLSRIAVQLALVLALLVAQTSARADVLHLTIRGDLDSTQLAADAVAALKAHQSASAIVIQLDGNRWRPDVVHAIAGGIIESRSPVGVLLMDRRDRRVGLGPLMLGMIAQAAVIDRQTAASSTEDEMLPARGSEDELARVDRELGGWLWVGLDRSGLAPALGEAIAYRDTALDATLDEQGQWTLVPAPGPGRGSEAQAGQEPFLLVNADRSAGVQADASLLRSLNLVASLGRHPRDVLQALGVPPDRLVRVEVTSGLADAADQINRAVADTDAAIRRARALIDDHYDLTRGVELSESVIARSRSSVLAEVSRARNRLARAETLLEQHPELLDRPAPVGTPVARTPQQNTRDWRSLFLDRRDDFERLESLAHRLD